MVTSPEPDVVLPDGSQSVQFPLFRAIWILGRSPSWLTCGGGARATHCVFDTGVDNALGSDNVEEAAGVGVGVGTVPS